MDIGQVIDLRLEVMRVHESIQGRMSSEVRVGQIRTLIDRRGRRKCTNERSCVIQTLIKRKSLSYNWVNVSILSYQA